MSVEATDGAEQILPKLLLPDGLYRVPGDQPDGTHSNWFNWANFFYPWVVVKNGRICQCLGFSDAKQLMNSGFSDNPDVLIKLCSERGLDPKAVIESIHIRPDGWYRVPRHKEVDKAKEAEIPHYAFFLSGKIIGFSALGAKNRKSLGTEKSPGRDQAHYLSRVQAKTDPMLAFWAAEEKLIKTMPDGWYIDSKSNWQARMHCGFVLEAREMVDSVWEPRTTEELETALNACSLELMLEPNRFTLVERITGSFKLEASPAPEAPVTTPEKSGVGTALGIAALTALMIGAARHATKKNQQQKQQQKVEQL